MGMNCKEVWREVSNYLDGSISPKMREELELHLAQCRHCTAVVDGIHNIIVLMADNRLFAFPSGFNERLRARLDKELFPSRKGSSEDGMVQRSMEINFRARKKQGRDGK